MVTLPISICAFARGVCVRVRVCVPCSHYGCSGQYTSKRMKEWDALQRAYEKDNIYLAESAQFLTSAVNFELYAFASTWQACQSLMCVCVCAWFQSSA